MTSESARPEQQRWSDALRAASIFAVDAASIGGVVLRAAPGSVRDAWLDTVKRAWPTDAPWRKQPAHAPDARLLGGIDLPATLAAGRPIASRGLYAEAHGGALIVAMAERMTEASAGRLVAVIDDHAVALERDGLTQRFDARFGVIALDEGCDDESPPESLCDRLAIRLDLSDVAPRDATSAADEPSRAQIDAARARLAGVCADDAFVEAACAAAHALGIDSMRAPSHALRVARVAAALDGRDTVDEGDLSLAVRLVFSARATQVPAAQEADTSDDTAVDTQSEDDAPPQDESDHERDDERPEAQSKPTDPQESHDDDSQHASVEASQPLDELMIAAVQSSMPSGLLARLRAGEAPSVRAARGGRAGALQNGSSAHGRPIGPRRGELRAGARLDVIETLRAAAPWQMVRRRERGDALLSAQRVIVRREDFRIARVQQRMGTTTIFVVDASGSSALNRLAEAKGAVELLLADCYVRRDRVALVAFRGQGAEVLLPPTRSLVRAKRSLASLPGGGGTPLAAGLDAAWLLAHAVRKRGETVSVVVLTDGRANIALDGTPGRDRAQDDAIASARRLRVGGFASILVDTSPRAQPMAQRLASEMAARYLPLPYADAAMLSSAVRAASPIVSSVAIR